jgi:transposase-like protein
MGKYKRYSDEFKRDVLAMVAEVQRSVGEIERDLGLTVGNQFQIPMCTLLKHIL